MSVDYDPIAAGYNRVRRPDPRIARSIRAALGDARTVVNVGAGAGSYEPDDLEVIAVDPSNAMIQQRPAGSANAIVGRAEALPFSDRSFDAALAILTVHHWVDWRAGARELRRVARERIVVFTWDPDAAGDFWFFHYFPEIGQRDRARFMPFPAFTSALQPSKVVNVPIPHDCTDGFLGAYWRRPHAYLDPNVRAGISSFQLGAESDAGLERLMRDLEDGTWNRRWGNLRHLQSLDLGYRLLVCGPFRSEAASKPHPAAGRDPA